MHLMVPFVSNIVNKSILEEELPDYLKEDTLIFVLKESEFLKNYRPISGLCFIVKAFESICECLPAYMFENDSYN